jgi:phytanoyl-CoA hydroxylase
MTSAPHASVAPLGEAPAPAAKPAQSGFPIRAPHGETIEIPHDVDAGTDPYLRLETPAQIRAYYEAEGYVVVRGAIPPALCDEARAAFAREVKPFPGYVYRQATAVPERNVFTEHGHVVNSLLNIQDLDRRHFPAFRSAGLRVITHEAVQRVARALLGEGGTLVQSMYFDGNPATWAHQDTYYLDSTALGRMAAVWVAVEDIHPGAGRFYVYPRSHLIDMKRNGGDFDIAFNHDRYKRLVLDTIRTQHLECRAPALRKGDLFFWSARTIHGSLETRGARSRSSFTAHFVPSSTGLLQFQTRARKLELHVINGVPVHHPKDQSRLANRAMLRLETTFPTALRRAKQLAIKVVTR